MFTTSIPKASELHRMSSKGAGGAPLPLHAHSPSPATGRTRRRMTSFLAVAILVFLALSRTTSSQLLFPVNNAQLPFDLSHTHDADRAVIPTGGGELWSEKRSPRIAIIGGGAAGQSSCRHSLLMWGPPALTSSIYQVHLLPTSFHILEGLEEDWRLR